MKHIKTSANLKEAILQLEQSRAMEGYILKEQMQLAFESIKPINIIKSTFNEVISSEDLKGNLLNTAVGITIGYLSKKLFVGMSGNPVKRLLGTALMFGISNVVAKHPENLKSVASGIFNIATHLGSKAIGSKN